MIRVLFVCLGNICRSPMAEGVFAQMVKDAGLSDKIQTDSAGTSGWHSGETAHAGTLRTLKKNNIPYNGRSRQLRMSDYEDFTYILAMDHDNLQNIRAMNRGGKDAEVALFLSYANEAGTVKASYVPDPYYDGRFDEVYELVTQGCEALLAHIRKTHNL